MWSYIHVHVCECTYQVNKLSDGHLSDVGVKVNESLKGGAEARRKVVARHCDEEILAFL